MLIRRESLQDVSKSILSAVDTANVNEITETLELIASGKVLTLNVTNREYFVSVKVELTTESELHATVNASLFLKLISQITTDTIGLEVVNNALVITGNGKYNLPLIYDGDQLLKLPEIHIDNKTIQFTFKTAILSSILYYNSKELAKGTAVSPVQYMYYVDEKGCITFTNSACINTFTLPQPIKLLLPVKLVKLFKLFNTEDVDLVYGIDEMDNGMQQVKICFKNNSVCITSHLAINDSLIDMVPADVIRGRADNIYPYSAVIKKVSLMETLNRLLLFTNPTLSTFSKCVFGTDSVTIYSVDGTNNEVISYNNSCTAITEPYETILDLNDLKLTLDSCPEEFLTLLFGDGAAFVISRSNVRNVIPECSEA